MIINLDRNQVNVNSTSCNLFKNSKGEPLLMEEMIFLDIETVSGKKHYNDLRSDQPNLAKIFKDKVKKDDGRDLNLPIDNVLEAYENRAGLMPEFGKIVCVSINYMSPVYDKNSNSIYFENRSISFTSDNEKDLIIDTIVTLNGIDKKFTNYRSIFRNKFNKYPELWLVGHNIMNFDIPFFKNRCLIHGVLPPSLMYEEMKKPWDLRIKDTLNVWRSSYGYSGLATLEVICEVMGVDTPKDDISGKDVGKVYYSEDENRLKRIAEYCEKDTKALKDLVKKLQNLNSYTYG